jgi:hypothetical protein
MDNSIKPNIPNVTVIGTCRVHHPLEKLQKEGKITINNGGLSTFVHSPPEILLRLKVLAGKEKYDPGIIKLQVGESTQIKTQPDTGFSIFDSDLILIEVSSLKAVFLGDQPLQFNEVNRHLCTPFGVNGKMVLRSINDSFKQRTESLALPNDFSENEYPDDLLKLVRELAPKILTKNDIYQYLDEILKICSVPVMFVNHINVNGNDGNLIGSRNRLCEIIKSYTQSNNIVLFEPAELFSVHPRTELLMKEGTDLNHYSKQSLGIVGASQLKKINLAISKKDAVSF